MRDGWGYDATARLRNERDNLRKQLWETQEELATAKTGLRGFAKENIALADERDKLRGELAVARDDRDRLNGELIDARAQLHFANDTGDLLLTQLRECGRELGRVKAERDLAEQIADIAISYMEGRG